MRPLPRLHVLTDRSVLAREDFAVRAAAAASADPAVALHARDRTAGGAQLTRVVTRLLALARPPEASVFVNGRPDLAAALATQGVQLTCDDLTPADARVVLGDDWQGWVGCSVHDPLEAAAMRDGGADFLMVGTIYPTASHPGWPGAGPGLITEVAGLGLPVIAIGGMTPERARAARDAGAYGVAAISAVWDAPDSGAATLALLEWWASEP